MAISGEYLKEVMLAGEVTALLKELERLHANLRGEKLQFSSHTGGIGYYHCRNIGEVIRSIREHLLDMESVLAELRKLDREFQ